MRPLIVSLLCLITTPAFAGGTSYWSHTTESHFKEGTFDQTVATNLGDLKLSRAVKDLIPLDPRVSAVNSLATTPDGTTYAGTGPQGVLLRIKDGKVADEHVFDDAAEIFSITIDAKGALLVGTSDEKAKIYRIDRPGAKPVEIFSHDGVQYIWSMVQSPDGTLYAATGPEGQIFAIKPDGTNSVLFDSDENNIVSIATDGKDLLYAGTDPHGLVYRINRKTGESFVLYDAAEAEINSLVVDSRGHLLAASGEAIEAAGDGAESETPAGRPEGAAPAEPIPGKEPVDPEPPKVPLPIPGEPKPIPKATTKGVSLRTPRFSAPSTKFMTRMAPGATGRGTPRPVLSEGSKNANRRVPQFGIASTQFMTRTAPGATGRGTPRPVSFPIRNSTGLGVPRPVAPGSTAASPLSSAGVTSFAGHGIAKFQNLNLFLRSPLDDALAADPTTDQSDVVPPSGSAPSATGSENAVYDVAPDGIVTEIFRQPLTIYAITESAGVILVATGGEEGQVWQINPAADETVVLASVESKQITALLPLKDGTVMMGLANTGQVVEMSGGLAERGTFTSSALDAGHISRFGKLHLRGSLPESTKLTVSTRSGNVSDTNFAGWSDWSPEAPAAEFLSIGSPPARFLQYRLTFHSAGKSTPVVDEINLAYLVPNLAPKVTSVTASPVLDLTDPGKRVVTVTWASSDPNEDTPAYALSYRQGRQGQWIDLKSDMLEQTFEWNVRTVPDGVYQLRVVASDARANPVGDGKTASRVSEAVVVDNTPAIIGNLKQPSAGKVELTVADRAGTIKSLEFSINSADDWQTVPPSDMIADSPEEAYAFDVTSKGAALKPGAYQVSLRATDSAGNQSFESVTFTVAETK